MPEGRQYQEFLASPDELLADLPADLSDDREAARNADALASLDEIEDDLWWTTLADRIDFSSVEPAPNFGKLRTFPLPLPTLPKRSQTPARQRLPASLPTPGNTPSEAPCVYKRRTLPSSLQSHPYAGPSEARDQTPSRRFHHAKQMAEDATGLAHVVNHRKPPRWKDLNEGGVALAIFDWFEASGLEFYAFSLEISPAVLKKALAAPSFSRFMSARIRKELPVALDGSPRAFSFVVEGKTAKGFRPHLHGLLAFKRDEAWRIEEALNRAGGKDWKPKRGGERQCDFSDFARPDENWLAGYALKSIRNTKAKLKGAVLSATTSVRNGAEAFFERWREAECQSILNYTQK